VIKKSYYDWPKILSSKSDNELKQLVSDRTREPSDKVNAAIDELKKRNLLSHDYQALQTRSDINNEQLEKYKGVGGWLLLLCFALTIGSPLRTLYSLIASYNTTSQYFDQFPGLQNLLYIDGFLSIFLMALSIRAGIALWSIKPRAVRIAKNYFLIFLGYSVIAIFLPFTAGLPSEANDTIISEVTKGTIQSLVFFGIWYWYLNESKRVKATYISFPISEESENIALET
jgi:hypothetical protein